MRSAIILQSEAAECGLASLAMVSNHHGQHCSLAELRQQFSLTLKGASLSKLISIAGQLDFQSRPLRLDLENMPKLKTPCILHWDLNHFVVLAKAGKSKVTILDPAFGKRTLSYAEVSEHFSGVALELTPTAEFKPQKAAPSVSIRQLTGRVTGVWRSLGLILLLSMALQVFVVLGPFFMQLVVDQVLLSADRDLLVVLALGFGLVLLLQVAVGLLRGWAVVYLSTRLGLQWMGNVFAHLLKLPMDFFEKRHLGDVVSRMGSVQSIQRTLTTSFVEALINGLMAVVTFAMMLLYSWKLALLTLVAVALYMGLRALVPLWTPRLCAAVDCDSPALRRAMRIRSASCSFMYKSFVPAPQDTEVSHNSLITSQLRLSGAVYFTGLLRGRQQFVHRDVAVVDAASPAK